MSGRGASVLILTPVPRPREAEAYAASGAVAYLPMRVDGSDLIDTISGIVSHHAG